MGRDTRLSRSYPNPSTGSALASRSRCHTALSGRTTDLTAEGGTVNTDLVHRRKESKIGSAE